MPIFGGGLKAPGFPPKGRKFWERPGEKGKTLLKKGPTKNFFWKNFCGGGAKFKLLKWGGWFFLEKKKTKGLNSRNGEKRRQSPTKKNPALLTTKLFPLKIKIIKDPFLGPWAPPFNNWEKTKNNFFGPLEKGQNFKGKNNLLFYEAFAGICPPKSFRTPRPVPKKKSWNVGGGGAAKGSRKNFFKKPALEKIVKNPGWPEI